LVGVVAVEEVVEIGSGRAAAVVAGRFARAVTLVAERRSRLVQRGEAPERQALELLLEEALDHRSGGHEHHLAAAAEQQSSASEEVSRNVESITAVTSEATEGAQQSAAASAQLSSKAEQLQQLVGRFTLSKR
ncbi:MAG: hypothetical protein ACOC3G_06005, partial [Phycisphaeraceae bacterium]